MSIGLSLAVQNWSLTIRCSLVSYPEYLFFKETYPSTLTFYMLSVYSKPHHHHHHVEPLVWISLSRHLSLSFISSGRFSGLHPVFSHSCRMYVRAGRPAFARVYVGVHRSTSLMSSSLLLQECPACLVLYLLKRSLLLLILMQWIEQNFLLTPTVVNG